MNNFPGDERLCVSDVGETLAFNTQPFKMLSHTLLAAVRLSACNLQWANKGSATSYKKRGSKKNINTTCSFFLYNMNVHLPRLETGKLSN